MLADNICSATGTGTCPAMLRDRAGHWIYGPEIPRVPTTHR